MNNLETQDFHDFIEWVDGTDSGNTQQVESETLFVFLFFYKKRWNFNCRSMRKNSDKTQRCVLGSELSLLDLH